jgi:hypothetical protein
VVFQKSILVLDTNFTEPSDWSSMLMAPDLEFWMKSVKLEFDTFFPHIPFVKNGMLVYS